MSSTSEMVVQLLLDAAGDTVEIEYHPASIDSMPHTTWMIRALGTGETQYLSKGTGHTKDDAERQATEKVRLLGVRVASVKDYTQQQPR